MTKHSRDVLALRVQPKTIQARYYNQVRLALARLATPLRIELRGVFKADLILSRDEWLCVDRSRGDLPLMAWRDFDTEGRAALHEPVVCKLHLYHTHAGIIAGKALPVMYQILSEHLRCMNLST